MGIEYIRIFDAGIEYDFAERFIVELDKTYIYGMSIDCNMPNGYCQFLGNKSEFSNWLELVRGRKIIKLADAPASVIKQIALINKIFE
jgi:hypothetical protein